MLPYATQGWHKGSETLPGGHINIYWNTGKKIHFHWEIHGKNRHDNVYFTDTVRRRQQVTNSTLWRLHGFKSKAAAEEPQSKDSDITDCLFREQLRDTQLSGRPSPRVCLYWETLDSVKQLAKLQTGYQLTSSNWPALKGLWMQDTPLLKLLLSLVWMWLLPVSLTILRVKATRWTTNQHLTNF